MHITPFNVLIALMNGSLALFPIVLFRHRIIAGLAGAIDLGLALGMLFLCVLVLDLLALEPSKLTGLACDVFNAQHKA